MYGSFLPHAVGCKVFKRTKTMPGQPNPSLFTGTWGRGLIQFFCCRILFYIGSMYGICPYRNSTNHAKVPWVLWFVGCFGSTSHVIRPILITHRPPFLTFTRHLFRRKGETSSCKAEDDTSFLAYEWPIL